MKHNCTIQRMLSALFLLLLIGAVVTSCGKDDDLGIGDNPTEGNDSGGNGTSDEAEGNKPSDTTEEDISFEDADVWVFFKINEGGQSASAVCEYNNTTSNNRNRWAGKVVIPSTVTIYGKEYSVTSIADNAFRNCKYMTAIKIPETVTSIGNCAFEDCGSLTSISIPESVTSIGIAAFRYCFSLTSISLPESVTSIVGSAFYRCSSLTSISIPESVTSIGGSAFAYCSSLKSISIPESVTSIGNYAFDSCTSLTSIICYAEKVPTLGSGVFNNASISGATLYVPASALEDYKTAKQWRSFGTILPIQE